MPETARLIISRTLPTDVGQRQVYVPLDGERIEFVFANRPGRLTLGFLSLLGVAPLFLTVERRV